MFGNKGFGGGGFGQQQQQSNSPFGSTSSPFGANTNTNTGGNAFGGASNTNTNSPFGGGTGGTGFGANTSNTNTGFGANTTNTNTGFGGFGQQNQNQNTSTTGGGLFGQNKPATGTGFGAGTGTSTTGGGLFGGQNQNQNQAQGGGGLFGQKTNQASTTGGGLFGQNQSTGTGFGQNQAQAQQSTGGGLFGQKLGTTGGTGTSGFGSGGGGLFGNTSGGTTGGGLFGQKPAFGAQTQNQMQQPQGSFLQQQQLQQQQQQQAQPQLQITPLTRPSDLPEHFQKELEQLEEYITSQGRISEELKSRKPAHEETVQSVPRDAELLSRKFTTATEALKYDDQVLVNLKKASDTVVSDAETCVELLGNLRNPSNSLGPYGGSRMMTGDALQPYFNRKMDEFEQRIKEYANAMAEVERGVDSTERDALDQPANVNNITSTLQEEYRLFMSLGNRVAELHHDVGRLDTHRRV